MSHFTVMVVGTDPEAALAPFHEFESTGINDRYVVEVDVTEEWQADLVNHQFSVIKKAESEGVEDRIIKMGEEPDLEGRHKFGYVVVDPSGALLRAVERTNPNAKWDWYQLGGRWRGYFKLTPSARAAGRGVLGKVGVGDAVRFDVDRVCKGDVDVCGMKEAALVAASERWDRIQAIVKGRPLPPKWADFRTRIEEGGGTIEQARTAYRELPEYKVIEDINQSLPGEFFLEDPVEYLSQGLNHHMDRATQSALPTFAYIDADGKWHERGDMGMFGFVSDEKSLQDWNAEFMAWWNSLPDGAVVSVYDCHI